MTAKSNYEPTLRQKKVNAFLQRRLAEIIKEKDFSDLSGLMTISKVEVTPDLREAKVWFSVFGQKPQEVLKILEKEIYSIQGELYKDASMKIVPKVRFVIDHSEEHAQRVNELIRKIHHDEED